ncbi:hypothetical protein PTSG_01135 [Salpingoeca rosetta]|uniref:Uncharacterized protein n=1 Tax=Salpingoeca rosetta (strain ATCC 50818 / BSB-021) TaxID=946362 RepID=F2U0X0_SALR5|nr:uncharacterized protein PTSG_01135 [Salpingoeca rosetta]EGD80544.1 hypothetical protein PTSG_01135 [Salpingoeca rosetta]|eukprot:XP_004997105.1 hypothetical protein PTSG_01135 [Salpingoeca rosetta]
MSEQGKSRTVTLPEVVRNFGPEEYGTIVLGTAGTAFAGHYISNPYVKKHAMWASAFIGFTGAACLAILNKTHDLLGDSEKKN